MQKYSRSVKAKVLIMFLMCASLLIGAVVSTFAIVPPVDQSDSAIVYTEGMPTQTDAQAIVNMLRSMYELNYFQTGSFLLCVYDGADTVVALSRTGAGTMTVSDGKITQTGTETKNVYRFTTTGLRYLSSNYNQITTELTKVYCYVDSTGFVDNTANASFGTLTSAEFIATSADWVEFADKVLNYDANINDAEAQGRADGYEDGYSAGYDIGEIDGYENGYSDGNTEGYETGYADGKAEGQDQGYNEGYRIGYDTAVNYYTPMLEERYNTGYTAGYEQGENDGYENGYQDGYSEGQGTGGTVTTVITEELDVGSIISALPQAAKSIINGAFGFEIFGINVAGTLTAILVVAIVAFVVKWLMSKS